MQAINVSIGDVSLSMYSKTQEKMFHLENRQNPWKIWMVPIHSPKGVKRPTKVVILYDNSIEHFYNKESMISLAKLCVKHNL